MTTRCSFIFFCLFLSCRLALGQDGECEESELGYACKKQMTDYYALHWSLGPTTQGAEAEEGEIAIAMVGETEGWVGFAFADVAGQMAPADFVVGYVENGEATVTPYRSEVQSITRDDEDDSVTLKDTAGSEEEIDGSIFTTIQFVRSLTDGTTEIVLDEEIPVNVAIGPSDELVYHSTNRLPTTVMLGLAIETGSAAPAPAPLADLTPEVAPSVEEPALEPVAEGPADDNRGETCTPSTLDYDCMMEAGLVIVHWTMGPAEETGSVPELADGEIGMAISAETEGYVAVSFAQEAASMVPADVILGWVDGGDADVRAYEITERSISEDNESEDIGLSSTGGTEEDGITTITFVLDGTFTFDVDLTKEVNMNWAVGEGDELAYHNENRGSFTIDFTVDASSDNAIPADGPGDLESDLEDEIEDF